MVCNNSLTAGIFSDSRNFYVTTSDKPNRYQLEKARRLAEELSAPYLDKRRSILVNREGGFDFFYVVEKNRVLIRNQSDIFFFHPSSAKMRLRNLGHGQNEYLLDAFQLSGQERVLDLTLGLGSDALLMGAFLPEGKVVGLESSLHIYTIVRYGLQDYIDPSPRINESMKRITPIHADYKTYLRNLPDASFDLIYCDPMFDHPVMRSSGLNPIRPFANHEGVSAEDISEMRRVTRGRIVFKTLIQDRLLGQVPVNKIYGSKSSGILYGVIL